MTLYVIGGFFPALAARDRVKKSGWLCWLNFAIRLFVSKYGVRRQVTSSLATHTSRKAGKGDFRFLTTPTCTWGGQSLPL
jgi:hypothetical protein